MSCVKCQEKFLATHLADHIELSLIESENFETGLETCAMRLSSVNKIKKNHAINLVLEEVRDEMRRRGHDDFMFDRHEWDMTNENNEEDEEDE